MPCQSGHEMYIPPTSEELRIIKEDRIRKETKNLAELLQIVAQSIGYLPSEDAETYRTKDNVEEYPLTKLTQELCAVLRNCSKKEQERILEHPQGIYVGAWWGDHKKLDEQRNS